MFLFKRVKKTKKSLPFQIKKITFAQTYKTQNQFHTKHLFLNNQFITKNAQAKNKK